MEMQSITKDIDDDTMSFLITIPKNDVDALIDQFTVVLAYQNDITPNPGETIDEAATRQLGEEAVAAFLQDSLMKYSFPFAAEYHHVEIVGKPVFHAEKNAARDEDFLFEAICVQLPLIALSSYDPVEITIPALDVTDDDVSRSLEALAQSHAFTQEVTDDTVIHLGDQVELQIETFRDGIRCDQLCSEARTYTTGADLMPEAFEQAILDMVVGETRTIEYDCPGFGLDEHNEPETEHYLSTVTAKRLLLTVVPELTDEWIRENLPEFETLAALKEHTRQAILDRKTIEYRHYKNLQSAIALSRRYEGTISEAVYQAVTDDIVRSFEEQLTQQHTTREEFLRQQGIAEQQLMAHFDNQVHEQLIRQLALDSVADHFGLEVDDEDLDEYFRAAASPGLEPMMRASFERDGRMPEARRSALRLKANDHITQQAVVHLSKDARQPR